MKKLRIATVGTVRAAAIKTAAGVPSPSVESMAESVSKPLDRSQIVKQEAELGRRAPATAPGPNPFAPPPPDLGEAVRKSRS